MMLNLVIQTNGCNDSNPWLPSQVTLLWAVNFTAEQQVAMSPSPGGAPGSYSASIPAGVTDPGCMIRWAVEVRLKTRLSRDAATRVQATLDVVL